MTPQQIAYLIVSGSLRAAGDALKDASRTTVIDVAVALSQHEHVTLASALSTVRALIQPHEG